MGNDTLLALSLANMTDLEKEWIMANCEKALRKRNVEITEYQNNSKWREVTE